MTSRSRFAEIFAPSDKDKLSNGDQGFNSQFFPMPCDDDAEEAASPMANKNDMTFEQRRQDALGIVK